MSPKHRFGSNPDSEERLEMVLKRNEFFLNFLPNIPPKFTHRFGQSGGKRVNFLRKFLRFESEHSVRILPIEILQ